MARIRSIKPEFFDSPSTAASTPWARLLYIAMWCVADDWGIGRANMKELAAFAFPNDDQWTSKELPSLCKEVADNYHVTFYTNRGRTYFAINGWDDHQVTQRRAKRRNPTPDDPESAPDLQFHNRQGTSEDKQGTSLSMLGNSQDGTGEQGNRGTGEQGSSDYVGDAPAPHAGTLIAEWIDQCTNRPPGRVIGQLSKEIKALLDEGIPYQDVRNGVASWHHKSLHPSTLASVVHEVRNPKQQGRPSDRQAEILRREMEAAQLADTALLEIES